MNGEKVRSHVLSNGDRIKVGSHVLHFIAEEEPVLEVVAEEEEPALDSTIDVSTLRPAAPVPPPATPGATGFPDEEEVPAVLDDTTGDDFEEPVPEGTCGNCGKPAPGPPANASGPVGEAKIRWLVKA